MTDVSQFESWDADQVRESGQQLVNHLRRAGIAFLPRPNDTRVQQLQSHFVRAASAVSMDSDPVEPTQVEENSQPPKQQRPAATPAPATPSAANSSPATHRLASVDAVQAASGAYPGEPLPILERQELLGSLTEAVTGCTLCPKLVASRTQTVFGEGNPEARFAFFGEGPGADEDRTGRPFIGKAGQLLTKMIEACHLTREETYILNTVKCRPPGNRNPEPDEVDHCRQFFEAQLACIRPEYIVCLGAVAAQALLRSKLSVGRLRQRFHQYHDSKVLVIYHPAYLLRNPSAKKAAWADLQMLMRDAGL